MLSLSIYELISMIVDIITLVYIMFRDSFSKKK